MWELPAKAPVPPKSLYQHHIREVISLTQKAKSSPLYVGSREACPSSKEPSRNKSFLKLNVWVGKLAFPKP